MGSLLPADAERPAAIYVNSLASGRGAERVIYNLLITLAERGRRVDLLVEETDGEFVDALRRKQPNLKIKCLRGSPWQLRLSRLYCLGALIVDFLREMAGGRRLAGFKALALMTRKDKPSLFNLRRYMLRERPETILSFLNDANIALLLSARLGKRDTRFVTNVRNHVSAGATVLKRKKRMRAVPRAMRRIFKLADAVVVPAESLRTDVLSITGLPPDKVVRILNPIDLGTVDRMVRESVDHPWFAETETTPIVIAAGKLKPQKDFRTLLHAFAALKRREDCRLVILGDGPLDDELQYLCEELGMTEHVAFLGHVANPFAYVARSQLFVLSSAWEGLPNVLIEALACGCPVVSTDCPGGSAEILEDGRYGRLVPVGNAVALADAMEATLASPPGADFLRGRAGDFTIEKAADAYEAILFREKRLLRDKAA